MTWLVATLVIVVVAAVLRGGKLSRLLTIDIRAWWLLPFAFLLQTVPPLLPQDEDWSSNLAVALIIVSFVMLVIAAWVNRREAGMWIAGVGVLMNLTVIAANRGMPVLGRAVELSGGPADFDAKVATGEITLDAKHVLLDSDSAVPFLADIIPLPGNVVSLGDVLLVVGLGIFLDAQLRKPPQLFRHRIKGEPGSAARN